MIFNNLVSQSGGWKLSQIQDTIPANGKLTIYLPSNKPYAVYVTDNYAATGSFLVLHLGGTGAPTIIDRTSGYMATTKITNYTTVISIQSSGGERGLTIYKITAT